jgi:hypothetical protein
MNIHYEDVASILPRRTKPKVITDVVKHLRAATKTHPLDDDLYLDLIDNEKADSWGRFPITEILIEDKFVSRQMLERIHNLHPKDQSINEILAKNIRTPLSVFEVLALDEKYYDILVQNSATPTDILIKIDYSKVNSKVIFKLVAERNGSLLKELARTILSTCNPRLIDSIIMLAQPSLEEIIFGLEQAKNKKYYKCMHLEGFDHLFHEAQLVNYVQKNYNIDVSSLPKSMIYDIVGL